MSNFSKQNSNDLDNYDAEIVEDIPEQFDLSRYRKQKSMNFNKGFQNISSQQPPHQLPSSTPNEIRAQMGGQNGVANFILKSAPQTQRVYKNGGGNELLLDNRYFSNTVDNPLNYVRPDVIMDQNFLQNLQYPGFNQQPLIKTRPPPPQYHHSHQLPFITNTPIAPSNLIQAPVPQYPNQHQPQQQKQVYHGSGIENYGLNLQSGYLNNNNSAFDLQNSDLKKKQNRNTVDQYETNNIADDEDKYVYTNSRRSKPKNIEDNTSGIGQFYDKKDRLSEFYTKDQQYLKKTPINDLSPDSDSSSYYAEDNGKTLLPKTPDINFHAVINNDISGTDAFNLKSNLKPNKKHGVKFDEKLEVYEVNNPHYGSEAKSEKREMKKKKKDKKKEDDMLVKTKIEIKSKLQAQKAILFHYYENTLVFNALNYYEDHFYRGFVVKVQDKIRNNNKIDDKIRDQFLQSIEKDNQITIDIINGVKNTYLNKLQHFCNQFQCQPENLHTFPGMMQTMHNIANSINYIEIINSYVSKESESSSTLSKILGHSDSKSEKSQIGNLAAIKSPNKRKHDILPPKIVINAIDSHVKDVAQDRYKTLTELIFKLREICENDLHLIRALFKYVLVTQLETLRSTEIGSCLMRNFDMGLESANTIFSRLCSFAGIENRCVRGLWKNITCEPGEKTELKCLWNIVYVMSSWRFIQPAFTPIKFFSKQDIKFEETEFYFLSDPDYLYYEFMPLDKTWIFGDNSLTVKDFEKKPILTPCFRSYNLSIVGQGSNLVSSIDKEPFKLTIQYPNYLADYINFKYKLKLVSSTKSMLNSISDQNGESNYNQYVISEIITNEDAVVFKIPALPEIGLYNFILFADDDDISSNNNSQSSYFSNTDNSKAICVFKLTCNKIISFEPPPNHIQEINLFGMNNIMKKMGFVCCDFSKGVLGTDREGKVNLVFEMLQPLDIEVYLYSSDHSISSKFLELCILKRVVHNFLILIIYPPHPGLYGLDIHGAPKGTSINSLLHSQLPALGKYLIKSHHQIRSFIQFPKGDNREWGPRQQFYDLGLHTVGNIDPYIINEDGKQIEIEIAMLKPLTIWYKFDYDMNGTTKAIDNYCFMNYKTVNKRDKVVSFLLRFPHRGFYHLAIMATEIYPSKPDEIVYNYLIRVQDPSNDVQKFPIILNPILWRECALITPKNYMLSNYDTHFSVIIPNTTSVQVTTDDDVSENLEAKEIENSWVGLVSLFNAKFVHLEIEFEGKIHRLIRFKGPEAN